MINSNIDSDDGQLWVLTNFEMQYKDVSSLDSDAHKQSYEIIAKKKPMFETGYTTPLHQELTYRPKTQIMGYCMESHSVDAQLA
ncbi:MAG: hypothetical protein Q9214_003637 [Letrouitia sp. 1 TL-2023]